MKCLVVMKSLGSKKLALTEPIQLIIVGKVGDDKKTVSWDEAHLYITGEDVPELVGHFRDLILNTYEMLNEKPDEELGAGPLEQKKVLLRVIREQPIDVAE